MHHEASRRGDRNHARTCASSDTLFDTVAAAPEQAFPACSPIIPLDLFRPSGILAGQSQRRCRVSKLSSTEVELHVEPAEAEFGVSDAKGIVVHSSTGSVLTMVVLETADGRIAFGAEARSAERVRKGATVRLLEMARRTAFTKLCVHTIHMRSGGTAERRDVQ